MVNSSSLALVATQFTNMALRDKLGRNPIQPFAVMTQIVCDFIGPSTALLIVINNRETEILASDFKNSVSSS